MCIYLIFCRKINQRRLLTVLMNRRIVLHTFESHGFGSETHYYLHCKSAANYCAYIQPSRTNILSMICVVFLFLFYKAFLGISALLLNTVRLSIYYIVDIMVFASNVCSISPVKCYITLEYDLEIIFRLGSYT